MNRFRVSLPLSLSLLLLASPSARPAGPAAVAAAPTAGFGFAEVDGRVVGGGPDWRADVGVEGFTFTPAFGRAASRTWPLTFALESARRADGRELVEDADALPTLAGGAVELRRAPGLVERYEARRDGAEQTFVLAARPAGAGDLVVRGRIATALDRPDAGDHPDGLRFRADGLGEVTIGGVTGVDAEGRRQPGGLRFDGARIEYTLPAAFLDRAAYPVVLDPLFGTAFTVASGYDETSPDVAYDASTGRFLVVWERVFASTDHDVRGQLVNADGTLDGGLLFLAADGNVNALAPRVANVNASNRFVVVWTDSTGFLNGVVKARTVLASTGALGATVPVGAASGLNMRPDVGGEYQEAYAQAMVVWQKVVPATGRFEVLVARLVVGSTGALSVGPPLTLGSGYDDIDPAISGTGLAGGKYLAVWTRRDPSGGSKDTIHGASFNRDLTLVSALFVLPGTSWQGSPSVDGDGATFLVAYEREAVKGSGDRDVVARSFHPNGFGVLQGSPEEIEVDVGALDSAGPDVTWLRGSALVAFRQLDLTNKHRAMLRTFDPLGTAGCEGAPPMSSNGEDVKAIRVAGSHEDLALAVFEADPLAGGAGVIRGQRFLAKDGAHASLGGACGPIAYASCARAGNAAFALRLVGAPAWRPAHLILGTQTVAVPCGPCALTVDPAGGLFLSVGLTDAHGSLDVVSGIPNEASLVGLTFKTQWLTVAPSGGPCPSLNAHFSNGLATTIE
ncbi:MAG: hypothetical protein ACF8XB_17225 [Planctomycetota bacterium JB042]